MITLSKEKPCLGLSAAAGPMTTPARPARTTAGASTKPTSPTRSSDVASPSTARSRPTSRMPKLPSLASMPRRRASSVPRRWPASCCVRSASPRLGSKDWRSEHDGCCAQKPPDVLATTRPMSRPSRSSATSTPWSSPSSASMQETRSRWNWCWTSTSVSSPRRAWSATPGSSENSRTGSAGASTTPAPEHVADLMADLFAFANDDSLPPVAQAAIAHAQFETIHPFVDGNGRTGRALIHLIFRRRGVAPHVLPPVSLVLATWAQDYVGGLEATRYRGPVSGKAASEGINLWIGRFATACKRAVDDASSFEKRARDIEASWRERLGRVRARSAADLLLGVLVGAPVITVNSAAEMISRSFIQTNEAISRLVEAGILKQVTVGRRNRAFEAPDIIAAFTDLERQLASPEGDTLTSEPVRRVPRRQ